MEYYCSRCCGHILVWIGVANGMALWKMLWPNIFWQVLWYIGWCYCHKWQVKWPPYKGIYFEFWGVKQNLMPYIWQMILANVAFDGWTVVLWTLSLIVISCVITSAIIISSFSQFMNCSFKCLLLWSGILLLLFWAFPSIPLLFYSLLYSASNIAEKDSFTVLGSKFLSVYME